MKYVNKTDFKRCEKSLGKKEEKILAVGSYLRMGCRGRLASFAALELS